MPRISSPKDALDYPRLPDDRFIIWFGNEHPWPDARREMRYLGTARSVMKKYALLTMFAENAETFPDLVAAKAFLEKHSIRRGRPYQNAQITTVGEMKVLRGYEPPPDTTPEKSDFEPWAIARDASTGPEQGGGLARSTSDRAALRVDDGPEP